ncbi:MAG: CBS domain-containing protein [Gemmatimonadetes bacterium]|nr:CBS domain-containing protein [Gemmatimonadota bacterium]
MSVGRICSRSVVTVSPGETIRIAAQRMAENGVGTLVVTDLDGVVEASGIVTDRDIAMRCVAGNLDPDTTPVSRVMTAPVGSVHESAPIEEALERMASAATRRLIVTGDDHRLMGILSLDDVLDLLVEEIESVGRLLKKQVPRAPI